MMVLKGMLFSCLVLVQCAANCPPQSVSATRGSIHYWFPTNKTSFHEANTLCQEHRMVLANISTYEKLHEVLAVVPGSIPLWVGIFTPFFDWLNCENEGCHRQLYSIMGTPLSYYELNVTLKSERLSMCLQLGRNGHIASQNCETPLQAVCEVDCSPPGPCVKPANIMYLHHGRWTYDYQDRAGSHKTFAEAQEACRSLNSTLAFMKEPRDSWAPNWLAKNNGGSNNEAYIGLDPNSLTASCSIPNACQGLKWLDGSPFEFAATHRYVETYGSNSVSCFVVRYEEHHSNSKYYIAGVNDCQKKRAAHCSSKCSVKRCPIPPTLKNGSNNWNHLYQRAGDKRE